MELTKLGVKNGSTQRLFSLVYRGRYANGVVDDYFLTRKKVERGREYNDKRRGSEVGKDFSSFKSEIRNSTNEKVM